MASGKQRRQRELDRRVEQAQAEARRAERNSRLTLIGAIALAVAILVGVVVLMVVHDHDSGSQASTSTTVRPTTASDFGSTPCPKGDGSSPQKLHFTSRPKHCIYFTDHYTATFETTAGSFTVQIDAAEAPVTANNFVVLALYHFYDGTTFHRVVPDYIIQGGDPTGNPPGTGTPGYTIPDEFPSSLSAFTSGSVAMANTGAPTSGGGQFFIWVGPKALPSPNYAMFGQVITGMDVVRQIAAGGSKTSDTPAHPVTIIKVYIGQASVVSGSSGTSAGG